MNKELREQRGVLMANDIKDYSQQVAEKILIREATINRTGSFLLGKYEQRTLGLGENGLMLFKSIQNQTLYSTLPLINLVTLFKLIFV